LNDPKDGYFEFVREPAKIIRDLHIHFNIATFCEAIRIPAKRRAQAGDIQEWGMKQMRNGANLPRDQID
ncbi:MAG: hypothetical protein WA741_03925, partial [Candidatus Sulfotelmatobacter sp.]